MIWDTELYEQFIEDVRDNLQAIKDCVERAIRYLESGEHNNVQKVDIDELFRAYHSIKGGSASFDLEMVVDLSHIVEERFDWLKSHPEVKNEQALKLMKMTMQAHDLIAEYFDNLVREESCQKLEARFHQLDRQFENFHETQIKETPAQISPEPEASVLEESVNDLSAPGSVSARSTLKSNSRNASFPNPDKIQSPQESTKTKVVDVTPDEAAAFSTKVEIPQANNNKSKQLSFTQVVPNNPDGKLPELSQDGQYIRLIYKSEPVGKLSIMEMVGLMDLAAANNQRLGISGLLFFSQQEFVQVLEGPAAEVHTLYGKILKDPRHDNSRLVSLHEITERLFPAWSMKSITLSQLKPELFVKLQLTYQINPAICQNTPKTPALLLEFLKDIYKALVENENRPPALNGTDGL